MTTSVPSRRPIRALMRNVNYNGHAQQQAKLKKSLRHSLRIQNDNNSIQWDDELSNHNLIFADNQWSKLDAISEQEKLDIIGDLLLPAKPNTGFSKEREKLKKYRHKVLNAIKSEQTKSNSEVALVLKQLIEEPSERLIDINSYLSKLEHLPMTRKNQRLKTAEIYAESHNTLAKYPKNLSHTLVREIIFKIPHRWEVSDDLVSGQELAELMRSYLSIFFKNYDIKLMVVHGDEKLKIKQEDGTQKFEETGTHVHVFIDARNKVTGEYDLRVHSYKHAEAIMREMNIEFDSQIKPHRNYTKKYQSYTGQMLQEFFRRYANARLFHSKGLHMEFDPDRQAKTAEKQERDRQAKLPKNERDFNFFNRAAELEKRELEKEIAKKNTMLQSLSDKEVAVKCDLSALQAEASSLRQTNEDLKNEALSLRQTIADLTNEILVNLRPMIETAIKMFVLNQREDSTSLKEALTLRLDSYAAQLKDGSVLSLLLGFMKQVLLDDNRPTTANDRDDSLRPK